MDKKARTRQGVSDRVRTMALGALFCALVVDATIIFRIPIPATGGYFNLGDTIIFIGAALFGPLFGMIVGGVGSAVGDILGGFAQFAPWTLVIKGIEGLIAGLILRAVRADLKTASGAVFCLISFVVAAAWMVVGYFGAEYVIFALDWAPPLAELPFNLAQGGISAVAAVVLTPLLYRVLGKRLSG
jgi:uncharacterized membrane protein